MIEENKTTTEGPLFTRITMDAWNELQAYRDADNRRQQNRGQHVARGIGTTWGINTIAPATPHVTTDGYVLIHRSELEELEAFQQDAARKQEGIARHISRGRGTTWHPLSGL